MRSFILGIMVGILLSSGSVFAFKTFEERQRQDQLDRIENNQNEQKFKEMQRNNTRMQINPC